MADESAGWSDSPSAVTEASPVAPSTGWSEEVPDPLKGSIKYGSQVPPEQAAKVLSLQAKTGLPVPVIQRNTEEIESKTKQVDSDQVQKQSPALASWLAENYLHYAIAGPDMYNLRSVEGLAKDIGSGIYRGSLETERAVLGLKGLFGVGSAADTAKVAQIEEKMGKAQSHEAPEIYGKLAESVPLMAGAGVVGVGATYLSGVGVSAAAAATLASIARATLFGVSSAGSSYLDYQNIKDENGNPIDPKLVRGAALATGVLNGVLQEKVFKNIAEKVPAFQSLMPAGMKSILQSQTMRAAIGNYLIKIGEQAGAQGGVQWINSMATQGAGQLAKMVSDGSIHTMSPGAILSTIFSPESFQKAGEEAKSGAVMGGAMATGFSAYDFARNYHQIIHATEAAKSYEDMGNHIQQMKMLEYSPEKTQEVVKRIVQGPEGDGPARNTYVPVRYFNEHYQGKEIDPREAFKAITGSYDGYDESSRTGADLQIPTEKYLTTVGAVPEDNKALSQVIRTDPEVMNAKEAEKASEMIRKGRKEPTSADQIKDAMLAPNIPEPLPTPETQPITPAGEKSPEEQAIDAVSFHQGFEPLFKESDKWLPADEAAKYNKAVEQVHARAQEEIGRQITDKKLRQKSREWNTERDEVLDQVTSESQDHKEFAAKELLSKPIQTSVRAEEMRKQDVTSYTALKEQYDQWMTILKSGIKPSGEGEEYAGLQGRFKKKTGRGIDEVAQEAREKGILGENEDPYVKIRSLVAPAKPGTPESYIQQAITELQPLKLSKQAIETDFPDVKISKLKGMVSDTIGIHPDLVAESLGFQSGSQLLHDMQTTPNRNDWIDEETDRRMVERHPDISGPQNLWTEAMKAVHNEERSRLLMMELKMLASEHTSALKGLIRRVTRPIPKITEVRNEAKRQIGLKPVADIQPALYTQEEARARREAGINLSNGDLELAFEAKHRELLNHEMFRAATDGKEDVADGLNYVKRITKESARDRIGKASGGQVDYLGQIDDILDRFDFRKATLKELARREGLRQFIENRQAEGYSPDIPEKLLEASNRKNYKELSLGDFRDVVSSLKSIDHLASLKGKLLANLRERDFDEVKNKLVAEWNENHDIKIEPIKPRSINETSFRKSALASMTRLEFLFDRLGGYKPNSETYQTFFKPTVEAQNAKRDMIIDAMYKLPDGLSLNDIFSAYTLKERSMWYYNKTYIPEIDSSMLHPNMLMTALNLGNDYNRNALKDGYQWNDDHIRAITDHLDERDWKTVQKIWDHLETYKPHIAKLERELNGHEPEWVEASPFEVKTKDGKILNMRGGYFPIKFDPRLSPEMARIDESAEAVDLFGGQYAQAMTRYGHTIAREGTGGKPLLLQFSALTGHIENVIHDLAWRKTIIDLNHLVNDPDIRATIKGAVGDENYALLNPWLRFIAGEKAGNPLNPYEHLLGAARGMAINVRLGLSITAGLKHLTNFGIAANEIGPLYAAKGFMATIAKPWKLGETWRSITGQSKMMAAFDETYDRDVREMFRGMNIQGTREGMTMLPEKLSAAMSVTDAYTHDMRKAFFVHYGYMYRAVTMPTYIGAYQKAMDGKVQNIDQGDNEAAIDYAEHVVRTTIASASTKDLPNIMNQKGLMKLFTMYYGPMNLVFNNIQKATHQFSASSIPKNIGAAMFLWFGPAVIQNLLTGKSPGTDDDKEEWLKYIAKQASFYPMESIIGLRDAARMAETGGRDFSLSPVADVLAGITKTSIAASQRISGQKDEFSRSDLNNFSNTAGYFTGMPTGQILKSVEYALDWMTGDQQPDNPIEGMWRIGVGGKSH